MERNREVCWWFAAIALLAVTARGQDVVLLKGPRPDAPARVSGEVVDFNGTLLVLRHASGREERIPASRVLEIQGAWSEAHGEANRLWAAAEFSAALDQYRTALGQETRSWAKRRVLAQMVWCFSALERTEEAAEAFLALYRDDAATPYFAAIPLPWKPEQPSGGLQQKASQWLGPRELPAARLLGAAWLLGTAERSAARRVLVEMAGGSDARLAYLAQAQLWRIETATVDAAHLEQWAQRLDQMPIDLQGGPAFVLGRALAMAEQREDAALAFLRTAILDPHRRGLAAEALLAAADQLEKMERADDAARLLREAAADYPETSAAGLARQRLEARADRASGSPSSSP